mgnify:CR=1 FL=1
MSHDCGNTSCEVCNYVRELDWKLQRTIDKLVNLQRYLNPESELDIEVERILTRRLINNEWEQSKQ